MTRQITYPPIEYLFFDYEQPDEKTWAVINAFALQWNGHHRSQFVKGDLGEWGAILQKGILDEEYPILKEAIAQLKDEHNVVFFLGAVDNRSAADFEKAPLVAIVGNTYPNEFVVNLNEAMGDPVRCPHCQRMDAHSGPIFKPFIIDESFLDRQIDPSPDYTPPGLDLINLPNGALLVSARLADILKAANAQGYDLIPVISLATGRPSDRIVLLRADKAIILPCDIHTPTTEEGICPVCGRILGGVLGNYYVRKEWLGHDQLFSRHPSKYASIYVTNELYHKIKSKNMKGLLPSFGIYECDHT